MELEPMDKGEVIDLMNMMFKFHLRTGALFKIEEFADQVFILTDVDLLMGSDVETFYRRNQDIARKIWFTDMPSEKILVNAYEDCPKNRHQYYSPYSSAHNLFSILNRTQSMSFILGSKPRKKPKRYEVIS